MDNPYAPPTSVQTDLATERRKYILENPNSGILALFWVKYPKRSKYLTLLSTFILVILLYLYLEKGYIF